MNFLLGSYGYTALDDMAEYVNHIECLIVFFAMKRPVQMENEIDTSNHNIRMKSSIVMCVENIMQNILICKRIKRFI